MEELEHQDGRKAVGLWKSSSRSTGEIADLVKALFGLSILTAVLASLIPLVIFLLNEFDVPRIPFALTCLLVQSILLPPLICFSITVVAIMFWHGAVMLRFLLAILAVLPGCCSFCVGVYLEEKHRGGGFDADFVLGFSTVMFTALLVTAAVALTTQLWGRWTLTHKQIDNQWIPATGIRSIIELTVVAAIGSAVLGAIDMRQFQEGIILFGGVALLVAPAIIAALIFYLRTGYRKRSTAIIAVLFTFATVLFMNGFFAVLEFGRDAIQARPWLIALVSLYGTGLTCGIGWICLRWLRFCGWRCIHRMTESNVAILDQR